MVDEETTDMPKGGEKQELDSIMKESPLYLDMSLRERDEFLQYLVRIILK